MHVFCVVYCRVLVVTLASVNHKTHLFTSFSFSVFAVSRTVSSVSQAEFVAVSNVLLVF